MLLSQDEYDRSRRFISPYLQDRFILVRATLRLILSQYIKESANKIEFLYSKNGKPYLSEENGIQFNLSHCGDCAVFAISFQDEVGIDLEEVRSDTYLLGIEAMCLSKKEQESLVNLPFIERVHRFYTLWVNKEALLKGSGCGLTYPLHKIEIDINDAQPKIKSDMWKDWTLHTFPLPKNFKGAIAVKHKHKKFIFKEW